MTRHAGGDCAEDGNCRALVEARTPVVTLVGKTRPLHVDRGLGRSRDETLRMIAESVAHFKALGKEVIYDAEHFFDGYRLDPAYALATLDAAAGAGADCVVLCDTNGGALPTDVEARVWEVRDRITAPLGIHPHNDSGLALANALAAVEAGCVQVQGTSHGCGERCGNLDLVPLIATLQLKLDYQVVAPERLRELRDTANFVAAVANLNPDAHAPYVGRSAFAHKGGIHVAAVAEIPESYQHVDPALVGNEMRVVVSELAGRRTVRLRAAALGVPAGAREGAGLQRAKELEHAGYPFEGAEGSFEMLLRRSSPDYSAPFGMVEYTVTVENRRGDVRAQASVTLRVAEAVMRATAPGARPVNALHRAGPQNPLPPY